jgi:5-methylcytosine-specific restriction protein B
MSTKGSRIPTSDDSGKIFDFKFLKQFCLERFKATNVAYREIAIKSLLESEGFTTSKENLKENVYRVIPKKYFDENPSANPTEMIDEYLVGHRGDRVFWEGKKRQICTYEPKNKSYKLLLSPTTSKKEINELRKICGQSIARKQMTKHKKNFKLWFCTPGTNGRWLDEFKTSNTIGLGYDVTVDLSDLSQSEIDNIVAAKTKPTGKRELKQLKQIEPGDIIMCTDAKSGIIDFAIALSGYKFEREGLKGRSYPHRIKVEWLDVGPFSENYSAANQGFGLVDLRKDRFVNILLGEESKSCDYWAILAGHEREGKSVTASWQLLLSSKKILFGDININLSDFYDEVGNYKHELPKGKKISKELRDEIKKKYPKASREKISWHAISCKLFAQVKKNDVVVVWSGNKKDGYKIHGHGKVVSEYEWTSGTRHDSFYHQKQVEWLDTVERELPQDVGKKEAKRLFSVDKLPDEWREFVFGKKQQKYFIITQYADSGYDDVDGKQYQYDNHKAGWRGFVEGSNFIIQSKIKRKNYFVGYGKVGTIETSEGTNEKGKSITEFRAKYSKYTKFEEPKIRTEDIYQKMKSMPARGGRDPAILPITQSLYRDIMGGDLIDDDQLTDTLDNIDLDECKEFESKGYLKILEQKKNLIFYGPPGTGKTRAAKILAECWCHQKQLQMTPVSETGKSATWLSIAAKVLLENNGEMMHYKEIGKIASQLRETDAQTPEETIRRDIGKDIEKNGDDSIFVYGDAGMYGLDTPTTWTKAAEIVLFAENKETHLDDVTKKIIEKNLVETSGKTPERTLSTEIRRNIQQQINSKFIQTDSATFSLRKETNPCIIKEVTFHPSYSYEDFVEGYRPKKEEEHKQKTSSSPYILEKGIFKLVKEDAEKHEETDYFLIIDEVNRGNISKILGELISLLEVDYRGPKYSRILAYSKEPFFVPKNIYVIGTMNTADKSLVQIDAALRRRFAFAELLPDPSVLDKPKFVKARKYKSILEELNYKILSGRKEFRDKQVGHSYFLKLETDEDVQFMFKHEIIPLLQDYFYYDYDILREILGESIIMKNEDRVVDEIFEADNASQFVETLKIALGKSQNSREGHSENSDGKYKPLSDYLKNSGEQEITLTFTEIEKIIGANLPPSALLYKAWWGNNVAEGGQPQRQYWISAGYRVKNGSVSTPPGDDSKVTFEKI